MRDNHVNNFRKLTQDAFRELLASHGKERGTFLDELRRQYEDKHPGDVSYAQLDLSSLLVSHIPAEFTPLKVKDPKLLGRRGFGRYGQALGIEDLSTTSGSKQVTNAKVSFGNNLDAALGLLAVLALKLSGASLVAMYPYKITPKKISRLSVGSIGDQHQITIPVSNKEEYNPQTQLTLALEILTSHSEKLLEKLDRDLDDTISKASLLEGGKIVRFPSIARLFQQLEIHTKFFEAYSITAVDEHTEMMEYLARCCPIPATTARPSQSAKPAGLDGETLQAISLAEHESFLSKQNSKDSSYQAEEMDAFMISRLNWEFLNSKEEPEENLEDDLEYFSIEGEDNFDMGIWMDSDEKPQRKVSTTTIAAEVSNYCYEPNDLVYFHRHLVRHPVEKEEPSVEPDKHEEEDTSTKSDAPADETFPALESENTDMSAAVQIQTLTRNQRKKLARQTRKNSLAMPVKDKPTIEAPDDSMDRSVSVRTKLFSVVETEDFVEGSTQTSELARCQLTASSALLESAFNQGVEDNLPAATVVQSEKGRKKRRTHGGAGPPARNLAAANTEAVAVKASPVSQKREAPVESPMETEPDSEDSDDKEPTNMNNKEAEKLKKLFKELLADQLSRIASEDDLDKYEKQSLVEINDFVGVSKKMKQKAKKNLRINIENRKKEVELQKQKIQMDFLESAELSLEDFKNIPEYLDMETNDPHTRDLLLQYISQLMPQIELSHKGRHQDWSGKQQKDLQLGSGWNLQPTRDNPKSGAAKNASKRPVPQTKWKERLQASISDYESEIESNNQIKVQTEMVFELLENFRGSVLSSILHLLYEGQHAIREPMYIERKRKVKALADLRKLG